MKQSTLDLDSLGYEFFREFARYEYCLKVTGLRKGTNTRVEADWSKYAEEIQSVIENPNKKLDCSITYLINNPPKKQVLKNDLLCWSNVMPNHRNKSDLVFSLICRVRNNLFHGGKFNGEWLHPQRSKELIEHALIILRICRQNHPAIRKAYNGQIDEEIIK